MDAEDALDAAGISVNKNQIPYDEKGANITSGIRIGTPAVTSRGMKEPEMKRIAGLIDRVIKDMGDQKIYASVREDVSKLCKSFPLYNSR